ncbi:hypothetical protein CTAYLR_007615 [Chrysophaeum taylorii]|uniref:F-box domain-containing protein n=1 Tax=Chrysophaeum taylorii TaxID=2483200 RepID=A0AAD7U787_9STRA|nr:hypothetical protein CTAYLR_007615 [Chrysophaeum taylorii]
MDTTPPPPPQDDERSSIVPWPRSFLDGLLTYCCEKLIEDTVPTLLSYMDSATLLTAAAVCQDWRNLATRDDLWDRILKLEFSIQADSLNPAPRPLKRLWIQMRRTFRYLLVSS